MTTHRLLALSKAALRLSVLGALIAVSSASAQPDSDLEAIQASMKGTWTSVCMDLGGGVYIKSTLTYDGAGKASEKVVFYKDAACTTPTGLVKTNISTYRIGEKTEIDGQEAFEIDVTIVKWELKQGGSVIKRGGAVPIQYDVVAVKDDTLFNSGLTRAKKGPITDPAERPVTLDKKNIYKRQGAAAAPSP